MRIQTLVCAVDLTLACGSAAALICLTVADVVMRYFVGAPLIWLEEVQMILIVWLVIFSGSAAFREHAHVVIDVLVDRMPSGLRRRLNVVIALMIRVPVFIALPTGATLYFLAAIQGSPLLLVQRFVAGIESVTLLAIPFFVCAGVCMNH